MLIITSLHHARRLWHDLSKRRKGQLLVLLLLMFFASFAEMMSIGAVIPFLGVISSPDKVFAELTILVPATNFFGIQTPEKMLLLFTVLFILCSMLAGIARIVLLWFQVRISMAIGADLSVRVFERILYQPYHYHLNKNSSEVLADAQKASGLVLTLIQPILTIFSSLLILCFIIATLLLIKPVIAISAVLAFGFVYICVALLTKMKVSKNSKVISVQQGKVNKAIQESLGGIRDVLIDGNQTLYTEVYRASVLPLRSAIASNLTLEVSPRYGVEALGMILIAILAYIAVSNPDESTRFGEFIPVLGALALGAQRLLPVLQQIYSSFVCLKGNQDSTGDALDLVEQPISDSVARSSRDLNYDSSIELKGVSFRYSAQHPWVLKNLNIEIPKGSRVGVVGITGSGKSTLLDVLMGLLVPTEGLVLVDKTALNSNLMGAWQSQIAHVPQTIFLSDSSVKENIAFGVSADKIDLKRVKEAAQEAQLAQTIERWENGYDTIVGERGIRLSGGQRQRIGIARALYKRAQVIFFDEATSSLDNETEFSVMRAIENLGRNITIFIVAHRLTTLRGCDFVVELAAGGIKSITHYENLITAKHR